MNGRSRAFEDSPACYSRRMIKLSQRATSGRHTASSHRVDFGQ